MTFEVTDEIEIARLNEFHRFATPEGECRKFVRYLGDPDEPFAVCGELFRDGELDRYPWHMQQVSYDRPTDLYQLRLGELKVLEESKNA
ncbi:MAG: hypothetical protein IH945_04365 [Armatimonadetes bacterium]|nr:hypothetical protein [Armatimonadota bacterium]